MTDKMVDVILHLDENTTHGDRENIRDSLLDLDGVYSADCHDEKPHLIIVEYNPDIINSSELLRVTQDRGLHAELVGL
jgi:hypothetical protein